MSSNSTRGSRPCEQNLLRVTSEDGVRQQEKDVIHADPPSSARIVA